MDRPIEKKKKKRKEEEEAVASRRHPCFVIVFFLFSFFSVFVFLTNETFHVTVGIHLPTETAGFRRYSRYAAGTASIFSGMKQGSYLYQCIDQYGIYWSYRPVRYGIDFFDNY